MTRVRRGVLGAIVLLLVAAGAPSRAAILLSISPATQTVTVGQSVQVHLTITGLGAGAAPSLGAYDVDISFDPLVLGYVGATFGDPILGNQLDLIGLGSIAAEAAGSGTLNLFELSLDAAATLDAFQSAVFTLARLDFAALRAGTSALGIRIHALGDALGNPLAADTAGAGVAVETIGVPEPGSMFLVLAAMFGPGSVLWPSQQCRRGRTGVS